MAQVTIFIAGEILISFCLSFQDRRGTIQKIADFLGKSLTDEDIDKILEHTSIENMRKNGAVNMSYIEKHRDTDSSEGGFINKGNWKKSCIRKTCP